MELQGTIIMIDETRTYGSSGFRKREMVIKTAEQYPQTILIEFIQDKTEILNAYRVGQEVKVGINIRGREWVNPQGETKYFNSIQGWRIENLMPAAAPVDGGMPPVPPMEAFESTHEVNEDDHDDLPF